MTDGQTCIDAAKLSALWVERAKIFSSRPEMLQVG